MSLPEEIRKQLRPAVTARRYRNITINLPPTLVDWLDVQAHQ